MKKAELIVTFTKYNMEFINGGVIPLALAMGSVKIKS